MRFCQTELSKHSWLEAFDPISYMAINTGKRYSSAEESVGFIKVSNEITKRIQAFPDQAHLNGAG